MRHITEQRVVRGYLACVCLDSFQDIDTNTVSGQISGGVLNSAQHCTYVQHSNRFYNVKLFFDFFAFFISCRVFNRE